MFEMFKNSVTLFLQGRLFQNMGSVIRQTTFGIAIAAIVSIVFVWLGVSLWLAIVIAAFASGIIQPILFKNLKYA